MEKDRLLKLVEAYQEHLNNIIDQITMRQKYVMIL